MRVRVVALALALSVAPMSACSKSSHGPRRTVTKTVDAPTPSGSATSPSASGSTSPVAPTPPSALKKLSGSCDDKLPLTLVGPPINESLPGLTAFVVGTPDASIHRVSYINCRYGLANQDATPIVEIQVSLYGTPAQAKARIAPTVADYKHNGASAQQTTGVGGIQPMLLTDGESAGYRTAPLILACGQRTVAVSV